MQQRTQRVVHKVRKYIGHQLGRRRSPTTNWRWKSAIFTEMCTLQVCRFKHLPTSRSVRKVMPERSWRSLFSDFSLEDSPLCHCYSYCPYQTSRCTHNNFSQFNHNVAVDVLGLFSVANHGGHALDTLWRHGSDYFPNARPSWHFIRLSSASLQFCPCNFLLTFA